MNKQEETNQEQSEEKIYQLLRAGRIKQLRKDRNLSQDQMAAFIGISQTAYANIENGSTGKITIENGKAIAKALETSFAELFNIDFSIADAEFIKNKEIEFDNLLKELKDKTKALEDMTLMKDLLLNEKENYKSLILNTITRSTNHFLNNLKEAMGNALTDIDRNNFEMLRNQVLENKQYLFDNLISLRFITPEDLDNYNKEMEDIRNIFK